MDKEQVEIVGHLCNVKAIDPSTTLEKEVAYVIDHLGNVWMIDGAHMRKVEVIRI